MKFALFLSAVAGVSSTTITSFNGVSSWDAVVSTFAKGNNARNALRQQFWNNVKGLNLNDLSNARMALNENGDIYVTTGQHQVLKITRPEANAPRTATMTVYAGGKSASGTSTACTDGDGSASTSSTSFSCSRLGGSFDTPKGIVLTGDVIYVADHGNNVIRKIDTTSGKMTTWSGVQGTTDTGSNRVFDGTSGYRWSNPTELAIDTDGNLIVLNNASPAKLYKLPKAGGAVDISQIGVTAGWTQDKFQGMAIYKGDTVTDKVKKGDTFYLISDTGVTLRKFESGATTETTVAGVTGTNAANIYQSLAFGTECLLHSSANHLAFDSNDKLWYSASGKDWIGSIDILNSYQCNIELGGTDGTDDGAANEATFKLPGDIAFDGDGNLLVIDDQTYDAIRRVTGLNNKDGSGTCHLGVCPK